MRRGQSLKKETVWIRCIIEKDGGSEKKEFGGRTGRRSETPRRGEEAGEGGWRGPERA